MTRRPLTRAARRRIWDAAKGICHLCGLPIGFKPWEADHVKPLWLNGEDSEANMAPACKPCHLHKSVGDRPIKAKSDRIRNRHLGIKKPKGRPLAGTRASGIRIRMGAGGQRRIERW